MEFLLLLGQRLKDDEIAEMLDQDEVAVVYDFDRVHENTEDRYWAAAKDQGYQLRFNAQQILDVIFLYVQPREGFTPITPALAEDVSFFASVADLESYVASKKVPVKRGRPASNHQWVKIEANGFSIHYEYKDDQLSMITLMKLR